MMSAERLDDMNKQDLGLLKLLRKYVRLCHIDTEGDPELGLEPEQPRYAIRILPKSEYGAWIVMIHLGTRVIELATGEGK